MAHNIRFDIIKRCSITVLVLLAGIPVAVQAGRERAVVVRVIDGDTLKVSWQGRKASLRLIGIDAPESKKNRKAFRDSTRKHGDIDVIIAQGKQAAKYVKSLIRKGDTIAIEFDVERKDRYRRLLGYAYLPDGRMLNDLIIRNGYASPLTIPPNIKYRKKFLKSYRYARRHRLGLWR